MENGLTLRALVLTRYRSIQQFAACIGWKYSKAYRLLNGIQRFNVEDVNELVELLEIKDPADIVRFFISPGVHKAER